MKWLLFMAVVNMLTATAPHKERVQIQETELRKEREREIDILAGFCLRAFANVERSSVRDKSPIINYKWTEYQFYIRFVMIKRAFNTHSMSMNEKLTLNTSVGRTRLHFYKFMSEQERNEWYCAHCKTPRLNEFESNTGSDDDDDECLSSTVCVQATWALVWLFLISAMNEFAWNFYCWLNSTRHFNHCVCYLSDNNQSWSWSLNPCSYILCAHLLCASTKLFRVWVESNADIAQHEFFIH